MPALRLTTLALLATLAAGLPPLATPALAQDRERTAIVSALDRSGAPVDSLAPTDLTIREDGRAREVLRVAPADEPMQIAVLVDNAQHSRVIMLDLRMALRDFVTALTAPHEAGWRNEVALITLADRPTIAQGYTTDRARLLSATDRLFAIPDSGTLLLDAIMDTARGFSKRGARRPVIVAITHEGSELSLVHPDQILSAITTNSIALHAIVVGRAEPPVSDEDRSRAIVLDRVPAASGGRHTSLITSMALKTELASLASELLHQFAVTWVHPTSLLPPEKTVFGSARDGLTIRGTASKEQARR